MDTATHTADYRVFDVWDNGEFLTGAKVALIYDGEWIETEEFVISSEFGPSETAARHAISFGQAFVESATMTLEERLGPYGLEWEREQGDRLDHVW